MRFKPLLVACGLLACLAAPQLVQGPSGELRAELSAPVLFAAGDSVRFVASFTVPATVPVIDSVVVKWVLGGNTNQSHVFRPAYPPAVRDTVRFLSPPLSAGGSSATGSITIQTWRTGVPSTGFNRPYAVTRAGPLPPPDIGGFAFVDSAIAYP